MSDTAPELDTPADTPVVAEPTTTPADPVVDPAGDTIPTGTIAAVLAWVDAGDDSAARAQAALDAELEADKPRSTLVAALETVVDTAAEAVKNAEAADTSPAPPVVDARPAVRYVASATFSAMVGIQLVTFAAGAVIDPLAGAVLIASGAPVELTV